MSAAKDTGVVNIHGKQYQTVAKRVADFREEFPSYTIQCELIESTPDHVVMKASILEGDLLISTGYAEERRNATQINKTSALENCETSAVGRALAFFGLAGTEIASADEVSQAISQQQLKSFKDEANKSNRTFMDAVLKHYHTIIDVKDRLDDEDYAAAKEGMQSIPEEDRLALNRSWTAGGMFTPKQTNQIKSNEYGEA